MSAIEALLALERLLLAYLDTETWETVPREMADPSSRRLRRGSDFTSFATCPGLPILVDASQTGVEGAFEDNGKRVLRNGGELGADGQEFFSEFGIALANGSDHQLKVGGRSELIDTLRHGG